jgi:hypothetical protein
MPNASNCCDRVSWLMYNRKNRTGSIKRSWHIALPLVKSFALV